MKFYGRDDELTRLNALKRPDKTSIVVITGRRRIGKSALVQEFGKGFERFYEFQGIPPRKNIDNTSQLKNFAELIKSQFGGAEPIFNNWTEAFDQLFRELRNKPALIFLDELSWMGKYDPDFVGKLKIAWDTKFSKIPNLIVVLCGSVSAWIEENILQSTDFVGRISLTIRLRELDLKNSLNFWGQKSENTSLLDRLRYLCVAGGIPKYLEEYNVTQSTTANLSNLCFSNGGYLFDDFEKIFNEVFEKKSMVYKQITKLLSNGHLSPQELADRLAISSSGDFIKSLRELELSGFVSRDYIYKPGGRRGKLSRLRISDNYLRFYLKYIEPNKDKIANGLYKFSSFSDLLAWETALGLQFENVILNHIPELLKVMRLDRETILSACSYFQYKTSKTRACQIDLLIECKANNFYICEIKFRKLITTKVISEVKDKIKALKLPKYSSRRPVLIYAGEIEQQVKDSDFFDQIIDFAEMCS